MPGGVGARAGPLHAALAAVARVLLVGAFAFDVLGTALRAETWWIAGHRMVLAGVAAAGAAAVAGALRCVLARPRGSAGWRRALLFLGAVALFALAGWVRGAPEVPPDPPVLAVEGIGSVLLVAPRWRRGEESS